MKTLAIALLFASTAHAGLCPKVEYAELRDWKAEQVEIAYCQYLGDMARNFEEFADAAKQSGSTSSRAMAILRLSDSCTDQLDMFTRVLQNVHRRGRPKCTPGGQVDKS